MERFKACVGVPSSKEREDTNFGEPPSVAQEGDLFSLGSSPSKVTRLGVVAEWLRGERRWLLGGSGVGTRSCRGFRASFIAWGSNSGYSMPTLDVFRTKPLSMRGVFSEEALAELVVLMGLVGLVGAEAMRGTEETWRRASERPCGKRLPKCRG
mmetsp:Transcript_48918/g.104695  ORF Transcript_48918/g.104695 Transcript_48918/m.104695 type:complete len:154 (-) Transcript_48918:335-796(-)